MESANMSNEEWKSMDVLELSNYMCSEFGRVFNISENKILKGSNKPGYTLYQLTNDIKKKQKIRSNTLINELFPDHSKVPINNYIWTPLIIPGLKIPGLEKYKICEEGKFLSIKNKNKIMKTQIQNDVIRIGFKINNITHNFKVCKLVATVFIPNPNNLKYVKFKDGDSTNVNKNNLEWSDNNSKIKDVDGEIWEPLLGFPKYQINPKGIRNCITHEILTPSLSSEGYLVSSLYINTTDVRTKHLHILMATQYIFNPDPTNLIEVNHKNGIKTDFRIENLEWVTHAQNIQHAVDTGLKTKFLGNCRNIELLDENYEIIKTFATAGQAGRHIGYTDKQVRRLMKSNELQNGIVIIDDYLLRYKVEPDLEGEIWKNVNTLYININDKYKVSNYGRLKNVKNKILTPSFDLRGYGQVKLSNYDKNIDKSSDGLIKNLYIHVLVAYAFLEFEGNRDEYQVNHQDKNPRNNNIDNLEILKIVDHSIKDKGKPVLCVTKDNKYYVFPSQSTSNFSPDMIVQSIHNSIKNGNEYKNHYWYHLNSEEAQDIIAEFQNKGINESIPPKEIIQQPTISKKKLRLVIVQ